MKSAGEDCTITFNQKGPRFPITDTNSPWWIALTEACSKQYGIAVVVCRWLCYRLSIYSKCSNLTLEREIFPAGSDCRYLRMVSNKLSIHFRVRLRQYLVLLLVLIRPALAIAHAIRLYKYK